MTRRADTFLLRESFEGALGALPSEVAPRLLIIGDFPAGRAGLNSNPPGAGISLNDLLREYSVGAADYNIDFAKVFASQSYQGTRPAGFDVYNVKGAGASKAESAAVNDDAQTNAVDLFKFEAIGPGTAYNGLTAVIKITRVIASGHPAGSNTAVCTVTIDGPNPYATPEVFENIVFTEEGSTDGHSGAHRTRDASVINDSLMGSRYMRLVYEATAGDSHFGANRSVGDTVTATLSSGTDGSAIADNDWNAGITAVSGLPFRWFVIPNPPNDTVRAKLHSDLKTAPFRLVALGQTYGETISAYMSALTAYGREADDGTSTAFFGWGPHHAAGGREVSFMAGYLGKWSAKISAEGLGGSYAVGNTTLGYSGIAAGDELSRTNQELASTAGINYAVQLYDGSYGVHGYWTRDDQLDRMGDASVRVIINDVGRRLAIALTPLGHNRANSAATRAKITRLGNQAIMPYVNTGAINRASTGTFDLMAVRNRWPGVAFPDLPGWAVFMASIGVNLTLGGILAHLTDADIEGLTSLVGGAPAAATAATQGAA